MGHGPNPSERCFIKFYQNTTMLIYLYIGYGCFHATRTEWSSFNRDCMAQKSLKCLSGLLQKIIDDPGFSWHPASLVTSRNTDSHTPDFFSLA